MTSALSLYLQPIKGSSLTGGAAIRNKTVLVAPTTSTKPDFLGQEVWVQGTTNYYKFVGYTVSGGYSWVQIQASSNSGSGLSWSVATGSITAAVNTGYLVQQSGSPIIITLPTTFASGDVVAITTFAPSTAPSSSLVTVAAGASTIIQLPMNPVLNVAQLNTTLSSNSVTLVASVANSQWQYAQANAGWQYVL